MMGNLIECENCKAELQPEDVMLGVNDNGDLVRVCVFCGNEIVIK